MTTRMTIQCPNCGQPNEATIENIIDAGQNPNLKSALLSGRLNTVRCSNCSVVSTVAAPLLYHDADKELLISFVPVELALPKAQQDKVIGDLLKSLTSSIPQQAFKGYMFQPRQALTMQGLVDQILQADGITPEVMEAQRQTISLIENLIQAGPDQLEGLIREHDAEIDEQFFQATMALLQHAAEENQEGLVHALLRVQEAAAELSSYGQDMALVIERQEEIAREVAADIEALGEQPGRADVLDLTLSYINDDERLQALVGLIRPAFDYEFFQGLTLRIGQAPASERAEMETLRQRLIEFTQVIDQQAQLAMQNAARFLEMLLNTDDVETALMENAAMIDDTFMAVLAGNIQEAERRADIQNGARLREIYNKVVALLQSNMQPELRFINDLLATDSDEDALNLLSKGVESFGEALLQYMDSIGRLLGQQGQHEMVEKLSFLREAAQRQLDSTPS